MVEKPKVVIDEEAKKSIREAYLYIRKDSLKNVERVRDAILTSIKELAENPERHNADKYRIENDGSFRAYEIYKYRVSYHVSPNEIRILRIRHTKTNPLAY